MRRSLVGDGIAESADPLEGDLARGDDLVRGRREQVAGVEVRVPGGEVVRGVPVEIRLEVGDDHGAEAQREVAVLGGGAPGGRAHGGGARLGGEGGAGAPPAARGKNPPFASRPTTAVIRACASSSPRRGSGPFGPRMAAALAKANPRGLSNTRTV